MHSVFPTITTSRLLLRQFVNDDIENVYKGLSHPDVIKYYGVSYNSLDDTKAQMLFFSDLEKNRTGIWWAICNHDNSVFFGASGLNNLSAEHKKAEIGFWLLPEFWGQGIIPEVVPQVCDYGFNNLDLHRIEALIETENKNSKNVMTKLKFSHEGTMRECEVKNGKFISLDIYGKLKGD
jgi:[ribosomal protein S5]-alanine N-acetyltransferase